MTRPRASRTTPPSDASLFTQYDLERMLSRAKGRKEPDVWWWIALGIFVVIVAVLAEIWAGYIVNVIMEKMDGPL